MLLASRYGTISSTGVAGIKAVVTTTVANQAFYTMDGTTWTQSTTISAQNINVAGVIGKEGPIFVTATANEIRYSADGITYGDASAFTSTPITNQYNATGADYYDGTYAVGGWYSPFLAAPLFAYSTNGGSSWTEDTPTYSSNGAVYDVLHDGSKWIVSGGFDGKGLEYKTTPGAGSWTQVTTPFSTGYRMDFDGTTYIISASSATVYTTTDLSTFTARATGGSNITQIAYGNGYWLASANNATTYRISSDSGVTWSAGSTVTSIRQLRFSNSLGKFIIATNSGNVLTSADGTTWTTTNVGTANNLFGIATQ